MSRTIYPAHSFGRYLPVVSKDGTLPLPDDKELLSDPYYIKARNQALHAYYRKYCKRAFEGDVESTDPVVIDVRRKTCETKKNLFHISLLYYTTNDEVPAFINKFKKCMATVYLTPVKCAYTVWVTPDAVESAANSIVRIEWVVDFNRTEYPATYKNKVIKSLFYNKKVGNVNDYNVFAGVDIVPIKTQDAWDAAITSLHEDATEHNGLFETSD